MAFLFQKWKTNRFLKRNPLKTADGSYTLHIPEWNEQYHSKNGALAEARHVFIKEGLNFWCSQNPSPEISILEIGFGTGLNCILTYLETQENSLKITYTGVEAFPLNLKEVQSINYTSTLKKVYPDKTFHTQKNEEVFLAIHNTPWEEETDISEHFILTKQKKFFSEIAADQEFNLIYFDAFGIRVQPELWTEDVFQKMNDALKPEGVLVTYAANGNARRAMQNTGFSVERLSGPPGKREMLRAQKMT